MTLAIRKAVVKRWNDAGLDAMIAPLFAGERDAAPEGSALPRAQYSLPLASERARSRVSRELIHEVRIQIWGPGADTVQQLVDMAEAAFVDSEAAIAQPLAIPVGEGRILSVDFAGQAVIQESTTVFQGILQLRVQWCRSVAL